MSTNLAVKLLFIFLIAAVMAGLLSPPLALAAGIAFGMLCIHPFEQMSRSGSKWLLQFSVVALGFGMNFSEVLRAGRTGFIYTAIGITTTIALGLAIGKMLKVRSKAGFLITVGTAICGGSAIAAIAPLIDPDEDELAMSMGTVFVLNSVALLIFPIIGLAMHLTQSQFGLWAALAIHDTSSVVGAGARFGARALEVGTIVKLTRALWIVPLALVVSLTRRDGAKVKLPWFILFFCLAALAKTWFSHATSLFKMFNSAGHIGLALTLFLIGSGINMRTVKQAGGRAMAQGIALWLIVATISLFAIRYAWIGI